VSATAKTAPIWSGARILIECLRLEGVDTIFGLPGGAILPFYDALHQFGHGLRHILVRHEAAAGHAADAYARVSGKTGVALVTSGPAVTNLVTALQSAHMDSIPLVAFTGQVPTHLIGSDAFQEADNIGLTRSCTKHNTFVRETADLARAIKDAFYIARSGRPGPVHVDLPKDVLIDESRFDYPQSTSHLRHPPILDGHPIQIRRAAEALGKAVRPVLCVGGGVIAADATAELAALAERLQIPATMTLMGLGALPSRHPLALGMLGMHGSYWANLAVYESDCVIAIGMRFDDRVTGKVDEFAPNATIIHIDIDPACISKIIKPDIPIVGDARRVLRQLLAAIGSPTIPRGRDAWLSRIDAWRSERPLSFASSNTVIKPQSVIEEISRLTKGEAIVVTGVGQHQMWAAQHLAFTHGRRWCTSGGLGAMGYGLAAALGAQTAFPDRLVVNIDGDGSFLINAQELSTLVESKLPVKTFILNNRFHGMVRQWQEVLYGARYSAVDLSTAPDFVRLAEAYGCAGLRITTPAELVPTLERALALPGPVVVDVVVDGRENVFPMVPPGAANKDMILSLPEEDESAGKRSR
jgi:acetolactate synthase I/II/III large subunit